jgi:ribosomal protein L29
MADPDQGDGASTVFLPVSEAALRLGLTPAGLRSRIRRRLVTTKKGNGGQWLIEVPRDPPLRHDQPEVLHGSVMTQDDELLAEVDELRRELGEERLARARLEVRLEGIERTHAAEMAAKESTITDLRAELARLRMPFWRKWIGAGQ